MTLLAFDANQGKNKTSFINCFKIQVHKYCSGTHFLLCHCNDKMCQLLFVYCNYWHPNLLKQSIRLKNIKKLSFKTFFLKKQNTTIVNQMDIFSKDSCSLKWCKLWNVRLFYLYFIFFLYVVELPDLQFGSIAEDFWVLRYGEMTYITEKCLPRLQELQHKLH